jgi:hypothetical protein
LKPVTDSRTFSGKQEGGIRALLKLLTSVPGEISSRLQVSQDAIIGDFVVVGVTVEFLFNPSFERLVL